MERAREFLKELERQPDNRWLAYSACKNIAENNPSFDELPLPEKLSYLQQLADIPWKAWEAFKGGVIEYHLSVGMLWGRI